MIIEKYSQIAKSKVERSAINTLIFAIIGGVFIALAGCTALSALAVAPTPFIGKILSSILFPIGLMLIVICGGELFTGNSLMIIPVLKKTISIKKVLKNWGLVYIGNAIGALIIAVIFTFIAPPIASTIALVKVSLIPIKAVVLGIFCNIFVCAAVWMATKADTIQSKMIAIFYPITIFVFCGFEHSIANMFYLGLGYMVSALPIIEVFNSLIAVTIGNMIGGILLGIIFYKVS